MSELSPVKRALIEIERLQRELEAATQREHEPLALIGLGCRFPGATDPAAFWSLLRDGRDAIGEIPRERWDINAFYHPDPDRAGSISSRWGGFLREIDRFDAGFFGVSPREATAMDPQQRVLLEVAWEAFEDAGLPAERLAGSATGVFVAICGNDYERLHYRRLEDVDIYTGTGCVQNVAAGRLAYLFDLHGPALAVDTACSASLVAVHLACKSLRARECRTALAAGVNLFILPDRHICCSRMRMLAPDGRCKTFDARADGFVRSEGCGVVILKRLSDALADGDPIRAIIRGSAMNQDGRSAGLTAPNGQAQQAVIRSALQDAGVDPADVTYVETHGAGTSLGDPIEVEALAAVYGEGSRGPCVLGAVKTNIGHTEVTAGVAGLIKTVLALERQVIPPNLHLERVNPNLSIDGTRLEFAQSLRPWTSDARRRLAAVSAFGWSGTNAHVLVEEAPARDRVDLDPRDAYLLPVSARSREALRDMVNRYTAALDTTTLGDTVFTAGVRRTHHRWRVAAAGRTATELAAALEREEIREPEEDARIVFVYPGQGGQWPGMGRELFDHEPVFRRVIEEFDEAIRVEAGWSLANQIHSGASWDDIDRVQPALLAVNVALTELWQHWGVRPSVVVGHSLGEIVAARVAGALSVQDAVKVMCTRSALLKRVRTHGAMAVVELGREAAADALAGAGGAVSIAAANSARSTVLAGDRDAVEAVMQDLEHRGIYCRRVQVNVASHCHHVDAILPELRDALGGLKPRAAGVRMVSTLTGEPLTGDELNAGYWVKNLREPVRFADVMRGLIDAGHRSFVEVGPHPVLAVDMRDALGPDRGVAVGSLRRGDPERLTLLRSLGALYTAGATVEWARVNGARGSAQALPSYAWQRQRYWLADRDDRTGTRSGYVTVAGDRTLHVWDIAVDPGHTVLGRSVMPAADYVEHALTHATAALGGTDWVVRDVEFKALLEAGRETQLHIEDTSEGARFRVYSRADSGDTWQSHASGTLVREDRHTAERVDLDAITQRCPRLVDESEFYADLAALGLDYSGKFRQVTQARVGDGEVLIRLATANLDACIQGMSAIVNGRTGQLRVPAKVARVTTASDFSGPVWAWARWQRGRGHVVAVRGDGEVVAQIDGLEIATLGRRAHDWLWELTWQQADMPAEARLSGRWLIVGGGHELARCLKERDAETEVVPAEQAISSATSDRPIAGVVWLAEKDDVSRVVALVQALERQGRRDSPRLWLITRGTQAADAAPHGLSGAGLWGLTQVLHHEHPRLQCTCVDLSADDRDEEWQALADEIAGQSPEAHVALRRTTRYVARMRRFRPPLARELDLDDDATYLITGGLGDIGLAVAKRLVERGARHVALVGRRPPTERSAAQIKALRANVRVFSADVGARDQVAALFADIGSSMPPLRGIFHAAGVLNDAIVVRTSAQALETVMHPKVAGAWNLHELSHDASLDLFVLFSSAAATLGGPGQAGYAAANAYLDSLAHYRRSLGLPALSIEWGRWSEIGMASSESYAGRLLEQGIGPMPPDDALDTLELLIASGRTQVTAMAIDFRQWGERFPVVASLPLFAEVRGELTQVGSAVGETDLRAMEDPERARVIEAQVLAQAELVLRLAAGALPPRNSLFSCGLDSMTALELRNRLEHAFNLSIPATAIWQFPTVTTLATYLGDRLCPLPPAEDDAVFAQILEEAARPDT